MIILRLEFATATLFAGRQVSQVGQKVTASHKKRVPTVAFHETILSRCTSLEGTHRCAVLCDIVTV
jgi:hypothetical protein